MNLSYKIIDLEQDTKEWLQFRKEKIGGSDIPKILGISSYQTAFQLWKVKLGFEDDSFMNPAMMKGKMIEPLARDKVNKETISSFKPAVLQSEDLEWAISSVDGIDHNKKIIWECKFNNKDFHKLATKNELPPEHYAQVQWALFVSGYEIAWYTSCNEDEDITVEIEKDFAYITDVLLPKASEFYQCLINFEAPPKGEKDFTVITDPTFEVYAHEYILNNAELKKVEKKQNEIKEKLLEYTDDGNCEGGGLKISRIGGGKTVQWEKMYNQIIEKYPDIEKEFPKEKFTSEKIGYWRISISKKEEKMGE